VVLAQGTRELLGNLFELQDLGTRDLKRVKLGERDHEHGQPPNHYRNESDNQRLLVPVVDRNLAEPVITRSSVRHRGFSLLAKMKAHRIAERRDRDHSSHAEESGLGQSGPATAARSAFVIRILRRGAFVGYDRFRPGRCELERIGRP